jgi:AraC-like DNA-binding protein
MNMLGLSLNFRLAPQKQVLRYFMPLSPKAEVLSALYRNCLLRSATRVEAHEQVAQELAEHALHWIQGTPDTAFFKGELNQLRIYALRYGAEVEVRPRPFDGFSLVHTSLIGNAEIVCDGHVMHVSKGRSALLAPKEHVRLRWRRGTEHLIIRVPDSLMHQVAGRTEEEPAALSPGFLLPRALESQWDLIAQSLLNMLSASADRAIRAEWRDHFEQNLALFILAHRPIPQGPIPQRPTTSNLFTETRSWMAQSGTDDTGLRQMDALLAFIHARLYAPISLEDLARAAGVSFRTLNALCHRFHGVSPMELLRSIRLDAVRARLLSDPTASITSTALAFGFGHPGRFSSYYFARFNELPRDTQKKGRR